MDKAHCLEISRNGRSCAGAKEYFREIERLSAEGARMRSLIESGTGCEYPKDCLHFPETSPSQSCCGWCLKRYEILYMTTVSTLLSKNDGDS